MMDLVLIRHAHAGPHIEPDFERNLSERGLAEAKHAAQIIKYSNHTPGKWLVSSANRTKQTAEIILASNPDLSELLSFEPHLYEATGKEYFNLLCQQTGPTVYLVGHNPSVSYLASYLTNQMIDMGTSDIVHLQWNWANNWQEVSQGTAELIYHFHGKQ
jgi:phosphohistidine phosphatase